MTVFCKFLAEHAIQATETAKSNHMLRDYLHAPARTPKELLSDVICLSLRWYYDCDWQSPPNLGKVMCTNLWSTSLNGSSEINIFRFDSELLLAAIRSTVWFNLTKMMPNPEVRNVCWYANSKEFSSPSFRPRYHMMMSKDMNPYITMSMSGVLWPLVALHLSSYIIFLG